MGNNTDTVCISLDHLTGVSNGGGVLHTSALHHTQRERESDRVSCIKCMIRWTAARKDVGYSNSHWTVSQREMNNAYRWTPDEFVDLLFWVTFSCRSNWFTNSFSLADSHSSQRSKEDTEKANTFLSCDWHTPDNRTRFGRMLRPVSRSFTRPLAGPLINEKSSLIYHLVAMTTTG